MKHNSEKNAERKHLLLSLGELSKIAEKYNAPPKISDLDADSREEKIAWLNERILCFNQNIHNDNLRAYRAFSAFKKTSREVRNKLAHIGEKLPDSETEALWKKFFDILPTAKAALEKAVKKLSSENKEIRRFEKFASEKHFGNEVERKMLSQSISDAMDNSLEKSEKLKFNDFESAKEAEKFFETKNEEQEQLLDFAKNHCEMSEQIQSEVLQTLQSAYDETEITNAENPFYEELLFIQNVQKMSADALLKQSEAYKTKLLKTETGKDNSASFEFYAAQYQKILADKKKGAQEKQHEAEILSRNLKADLQKSIMERYVQWQLNEIDKKRKAYLEELYKKIAQFKKIEELLQPFVKHFGRLWDLSLCRFDDYGFEVLKRFADLLENDESLKELADLIGRQEGEKERFEKELRDKVEIKTEFHPKNAYRGQISGVRLSGEIPSALPSELALSKNPRTKLYFAQKFAEKKLLSYAYINQQKNFREEHSTETVEISVKEKEKKGPVIICVDTSGSMNGTPERVAKTITFALAKKCLDEERKCFLISFSTGIEVQDLSHFEKSNGLNVLVQFLRKSFNGGTDASPALEKSLELLSSNDWKNADVLVVSDMVMGSFSAELEARIKAQQIRTQCAIWLKTSQQSKNKTAPVKRNSLVFGKSPL